MPMKGRVCWAIVFFLEEWPPVRFRGPSQQQREKAGCHPGRSAGGGTYSDPPTTATSPLHQPGKILNICLERGSLAHQKAPEFIAWKDEERWGCRGGFGRAF